MKKLIVVFAAAMLAACASVPAPAPAPAPDWRANVETAKAAGDVDAMLALLQEALPDREVMLSGSSDAEHVSPDDNKPAPIVNFDPRLQLKQSARPRSGGNTRSLAKNFGYYFSRNGIGYLVLGPAALDPRSPILTRMAAEHELFHAMNHVGDPRPMDDRELETWSTIFVRFFDDVHPFKQQWRPMLNYYEKAEPAERATAIHRLASYYQNAQPPARTAFEEWLERRKADSATSQLVRDLSAAISGATGDRHRVTESTEEHGAPLRTSASSATLW